VSIPAGHQAIGRHHIVPVTSSTDSASGAAVSTAATAADNTRTRTFADRGGPWRRGRQSSGPVQKGDVSGAEGAVGDLGRSAQREQPREQGSRAVRTGGTVVRAHLQQASHLHRAGGEQDDAGQGGGQHPQDGECRRVVSGRMGTFAGEDGLDLPVIEGSEGGGGDHHGVRATGGAVGGALGIVDDHGIDAAHPAADETGPAGVSVGSPPQPHQSDRESATDPRGGRHRRRGRGDSGHLVRGVGTPSVSCSRARHTPSIDPPGTVRDRRRSTTTSSAAIAHESTTLPMAAVQAIAPSRGA